MRHMRMPHMLSPAAQASPARHSASTHARSCTDARARRPAPATAPPRRAAGMATDAFVDFVVGHGELWSAQLLAATVAQQGGDVAFMDTRDVLVVTPTSDGTSVDLDEATSNARLDAWFKAHGNHKLVVATGFIAKNPA